MQLDTGFNYEKLIDKNQPNWQKVIYDAENEEANNRGGLLYTDPSNYLKSIQVEADDAVRRSRGTIFERNATALSTRDSEGATSLGYFLRYELSTLFNRNFAQLFPATPLVSLLALENYGGFSEVILSKQLGWTGTFTISDPASQAKEIPNNEIKIAGTPRQIVPHTFDAFYNLNLNELAHSAHIGQNLQMDTLEGVFLKYNQKVQENLALGVPNKMIGLYNNEYVTPLDSPDEFASMSATDIYNYIVREVWAPIVERCAGNMNYLPTHLILSPNTWGILKGIQYTFTDAASNLGAIPAQSILQVLVANLNVMPIIDTFLSGSYFGESGDRMMFLNVNRDVVYANIPVPLNFSAPFTKGFEIVNYAQYRVAGVDIVKSFPLSIVKGV